MKGISKETILQELSGCPFPERVYELTRLLDKCKELNPWLPIDENTPKDRPLLLFVKYPEYIIEGSYDEDYEEWHDIYFNVITKPTHYQELPEAPI